MLELEQKARAQESTQAANHLASNQANHQAHIEALSQAQARADRRAAELLAAEQAKTAVEKTKVCATLCGFQCQLYFSLVACCDVALHLCGYQALFLTPVAHTHSCWVFSKHFVQIFWLVQVVKLTIEIQEAELRLNQLTASFQKKIDEQATANYLAEEQLTSSQKALDQMVLLGGACIGW